VLLMTWRSITISPYAEAQLAAALETVRRANASHTAASAAWATERVGLW